MPRPRKYRKVCCLPESNIFGPVPAGLVKEGAVILKVDEYETIRLIDFEGMSQEDCAKSMNVARTTVQRMYVEARKKVSDCLVNGKLLKIEGGEYKLYDENERMCGYGRCRKHKTLKAIKRKTGKQMKIALPVDGDSLEGMIAGSFGRTKKFIIADKDTLEYELRDNDQNLQAAQGAGIQSAQNIAEYGAEAVISLNLGPKAFKVLKGSGIAVYEGKKGSIRENIEAFKAGELHEMESANMESHWV